ncbi:MAG: M28 family peptidase [Gemmatimonadota bacterium]|nr:MAG: M28 family peptidase [Gemmatimonadota bacterium]
MRPWILVILTAAPVSAACGGTPNQQEQQAGQAMAASRLRHHVEVLAHDSLGGRGTGQSGYLGAARYAAQVMEQTGLEPAFRDHEGGPTYLQQVPLVRCDFSDRDAVALRIAQADTTVEQGESGFTTFHPGPATRRVRDAPLVFAGYGLRAPEQGWDDFAGLELEGRAVVLLAGLPGAGEIRSLPGRVRRSFSDRDEAARDAIAYAIEHGAAAILIVPDRLLLGRWDDIPTQRAMPRAAEYSEGIMGAPALPIPVILLRPPLVEFLFRGSRYDPMGRTGEYRTFQLAGALASVNMETSCETIGAPNVVGVIHGTDSDLRSEYIVVSAHLDGLGERGGAIYNGANDDASGSAAALEIGKELAQYPPERSVVVALFTGEELGHIGSVYFVDHPPFALARIVANLNLEHYGRLERGNRCDALGPPELVEVLERNLGDVDLELVPSPSAIRGADQYTFFLREIPALNIGCGPFDDYHTPRDDANRIDYDLLERNTRLAYRFVRDLASRD